MKLITHISFSNYNKNNGTCNVICLGITEIQSEPLVNNSMLNEGFTLEIQINSQQKNGSIKGIP